MSTSRIGFAAVAAAFLSAASAQPASGLRPTLSLVSDRPAVVRGTGFRPHEKVSVTMSWAAARVARTAVASARGTFVVRLPAGTPICQPFSLEAAGSRGSRVRRLFRVHLACETPDSPNS